MVGSLQYSAQTTSSYGVIFSTCSELLRNHRFVILQLSFFPGCLMHIGGIQRQHARLSSSEFPITSGYQNSFMSEHSPRYLHLSCGGKVYGGASVGREDLSFRERWRTSHTSVETSSKAFCFALHRLTLTKHWTLRVDIPPMLVMPLNFVLHVRSKCFVINGDAWVVFRLTFRPYGCRFSFGFWFCKYFTLTTVII